MRVITGSARGRRLVAPPDESIRPTADSVKEAVFNILQFEIPGKHVLDLFAGTGQIGIECLSRGAADCTFVDQDPQAIKIVKENLKRSGLPGRVVCTNALSFLKNGQKFDLIYVDPPYDACLYEPVLKAIDAIDILLPGGIIVCESRRNYELPAAFSRYSLGKTYLYGRIKISLYRKESGK